MLTTPPSARMKPAIRFSRVDFPHPEGPTMATNSPSPTVRLTSSITLSCPRSDGKLLRTSRTSILVRIAPPHPGRRFQQAHEAVQRQTDQADDDHAGDHQVVAVSGIARVHDH